MYAIRRAPLKLGTALDQRCGARGLTRRVLWLQTTLCLSNEAGGCSTIHGWRGAVETRSPRESLLWPTRCAGRRRHERGDRLQSQNATARALTSHVRATALSLLSASQAKGDSRWLSAGRCTYGGWVFCGRRDAAAPSPPCWPSAP
eukprot:1446416-Prymnesium_polylepis.2